MLFDGREDRPWGDEARASDFVFIGRKLDREELRRGFMPSTVDGRTFIMEVGENNDKTTLLEATGDELVEYARFNGYMTGFVRVGNDFSIFRYGRPPLPSHDCLRRR